MRHGSLLSTSPGSSWLAQSGSRMGHWQQCFGYTQPSMSASFLRKAHLPVTQTRPCDQRSTVVAGGGTQARPCRRPRASLAVRIRGPSLLCCRTECSHDKLRVRQSRRAGACSDNHSLQPSGGAPLPSASSPVNGPRPRSRVRGQPGILCPTVVSGCHDDGLGWRVMALTRLNSAIRTATI